MERTESVCIKLENHCPKENHDGPIPLSIKHEGNQWGFIFFNLKIHLKGNSLLLASRCCHVCMWDIESQKPLGTIELD